MGAGAWLQEGRGNVFVQKVGNGSKELRTRYWVLQLEGSWVEGASFVAGTVSPSARVLNPNLNLPNDDR